MKIKKERRQSVRNIDELTHSKYWTCSCDHFNIHPRSQGSCPVCEHVSVGSPNGKLVDIREKGISKIYSKIFITSFRDRTIAIVVEDSFTCSVKKMAQKYVTKFNLGEDFADAIVTMLSNPFMTKELDLAYLHRCKNEFTVIKDDYKQVLEDKHDIIRMYSKKSLKSLNEKQG